MREFSERYDRLVAEQHRPTPRALVVGRGQLRGQDRSRVTEFETLTQRQYIIFVMLARGVSIKACAGLNQLSPKTVEHHWAAIKRKLKIVTLIEAAHLGLRFGMVENLFINRNLFEPRKKP